MSFFFAYRWLWLMISRLAPSRAGLSDRYFTALTVVTSLLLSGTTDLNSTSAEEHTVSQALGLSHCHQGMTEFHYMRPGDESLVHLSKQLEGTSAERWIGPAEPFEHFRPVFGASCRELESITLARPWNYAGIRPFLVVGRSKRPIQRIQDSRETQRVESAWGEYLTWKNDLAFAHAKPQIALHGTASEIRRSLAGPYDCCGPHVTRR